MKRIIPSTVLLLLSVGLCGAASLYSAFDLGVATAVGTNTSNQFNNFTGLLSGFNAATDIDTLESLTLGTVNGSLGTAHGIGITAACTGCDTTVESGSNLVSGIVNDGDNQNGYNTTPAGAQFYRIGGAEVGGISQTTVLTLTFVSGVTAFGLEITDVQNFFGTTTVAFNDGSPEMMVLSNTGSATGCPSTCPAAGDQFFGFTTTTPVTSVTITTVQTHTASNLARDVFGIDQLVIGTVAAVPEPATFGLVGAALICAAAVRSRRRRRI